MMKEWLHQNRWACCIQPNDLKKKNKATVLLLTMFAQS